MTTERFMEIVLDRGLYFRLKDGELEICGEPEGMTPKLLAVLKWHRERIIDLLSRETAQ